MKKLLAAALFLVMVTTASAETCVGVVDGAVGYYRPEDLDLVRNLMNSGAGEEVTVHTIRDMIRLGRGIEIHGVQISNVQIRGLYAVGLLPNGRKICTFVRWLRCK